MHWFGPCLLDRMDIAIMKGSKSGVNGPVEILGSKILYTPQTRISLLHKNHRDQCKRDLEQKARGTRIKHRCLTKWTGGNPGVQ